MSAKSLFWMTAGAVALGGLAYYLNENRSESTAQAQVGKLLPDLRAKLNDVDQLAFQTANGPLTLTKSGEAWTVKERGNFPADPIKVGTYLLALEGSERVEQKTSKPERYVDLGLDPKAETDPASRVSVSAGGNQVADLWVGKRRSTGSETAYYVRVEGEPAAWVAEGDLAVSDKLTDWADTALVDIARDRAMAVRIEHPDGNLVQAAKGAEDDSNTRMTLMQIPPGQELQGEWVTSRFDSALAGLTFEDVEPAEGSDFPEAEAVKATYWTKHGLAVTVATVEDDEGKLRSRVSAAYDPSGSPKSEPEIAEADPLDVSLTEDADDAASDAGAEDAEVPPTPEELQDEADAINARTSGWIYVLPSFKASGLRATMDEMVKPIEPEGDPAEGALQENGLPTDLNGDLNGLLEGLEQEADQSLEQAEDALKDAAGDAEKDLLDAADSLQDQAADQAEELLEKAKEGGGNVLDEAQDAAKGATDKILEGAEDTKKELGDALNDLLKGKKEKGDG